MEPKAKRITEAVDEYLKTDNPVDNITRRYSVSSRDLYTALRDIDAPLRGVDNWKHKMTMSKDEAKDIVSMFVKDNISMSYLSRIKNQHRITLYRGVLYHVVEALKNGEDIREWLS